MLLSLFSSLGAKIAGLAVIAVGLLGAYFGIRKSGVQAQQNADMKQSLKNVVSANEIANGVGRLSDASVDSQLRKSFSRD